MARTKKGNTSKTTEPGSKRHEHNQSKSRGVCGSHVRRWVYSNMKVAMVPTRTAAEISREVNKQMKQIWKIARVTTIARGRKTTTQDDVLHAISLCSKYH